MIATSGRASAVWPLIVIVIGTSTSAAAQTAEAAESTARQATPSPAPAPPPAASRAPLVNRANERMPSWLRIRGEFRERMEGFAGAGFDSSRDDLYWLSRLRFNTTVTPSASLSFQVQVQDARVAKKRIGPTGAPFKAPLDLRLAFADVGTATGPLSVRVGRQELVYGEQRLVGHVSWLNAARSFDGVKLTLRHEAFSADLFATSVVRVLDGAFDRSGNGNRFAGVYATSRRLLPKASVEPYVFFRRDVDLRGETGALGNLQATTTGVRVAGALPARLDYGVEMAMQRGSLGTDTVRAWAGHWQLRESLAGRGALTLTAEYNFASGDDDPLDGIRGTFDQLYPTPHDKYGLADQIGWKNLHHARGGFELTPLTGTPITANYHSWWMAERADAVYAASNAVVARVPGGASDRHIGQELDIQVARSLTPQLQLAAGYAHIFTGRVLKQATPGASYSHPYVMATYVFLAEK